MKYLILLLLFLSSVNFPQTSNWTNVKETNINVVNADPFRFDFFTNRYGNHIIFQEDNILKYYRMDVDGYSDPHLFPRPIESSSVFSPSISGDDNNLYVVYGLGNEVRVKRSTNGGLSWSLWYPSFSLSTNVTEWGLESVVSGDKIHVTYLEQGVVRYRFRSLTGGDWSPVLDVSDGESGNFPRITAYKYYISDFVYFMYRKFNHVDYDCKWRRFDVSSGTWDTPIYTAPIELNEYDETDKFLGIRADYQNVIIYFEFHRPPPTDYFFAWINLDLNNNPISYGNADLNNQENHRMYSTPTADGKTHTVFYWNDLAEGGSSDHGLWRSFSAEMIPTDEFYQYVSNQVNFLYHLNLSSAGNDVHVIWKDPYGPDGGSNLRYKYDDQIPLAPAGLTVTEGANNHPRLDWNVGPEPDRHIYKIYRFDSYGGGWQNIDSTTATTYTDQEFTYCHAIPPATCANYRNISYRVTVVDKGSHESDPSLEVIARLVGGAPSKAGAGNKDVEKVTEYSLVQNYPNPFNPITTINYSIKSAGMVTLKAYDMLGREVATLVNEMKGAGNFSVEFNASELPSGIYVYRLTAGNFVDTKKLILLK